VIVSRVVALGGYKCQVYALRYDEPNDKNNHIYIRGDAILGATVRSECLEMGTG
jgi:hypothetical protein